MTPAISGLRPGDLVRIRDERWRVLACTPCGATAIVETTGCEKANRAVRARFLLPFEPIDRLPSATAPKVVRPARWRRAARGVLTGVAPSWTSLRSATGADITLIPYQLEPALALVDGRACRFLLADEVGLGKTVQAGLMMAEAIARRPETRALIVAPAGLRLQWQRELTHRFRLDAEVLDAAGLARISATVPSHVNPWSLPPIVITSIDYIKRPEVMRSLEMLTWDFVAFDEAHNLAGRSDRAAAAQLIAGRSRIVVLLTATPHSGDEAAFQKLCAIGDIRSRYPLAMFRRTRADAGMAVRRRIASMRVRPTAAESAMHAALISYARRAWTESSGESAPAVRLVMTVLGRRACSSAGSLGRSLERRLAALEGDAHSDVQLHLPFADISTDDDEGDAWLGYPGLRDGAEERALLGRLLTLATAASVRESKLAWLARFVRRVNEPVIVFTEYRDTLERVAAAVAGLDAVCLHGGLTEYERHEVLLRFTTGSARLLLATDAASEGLNLHPRCRLVINLELPWTPMRLDQRAGRVDRIGQHRTVHCLRLIAAGTCEEGILARLTSRTDRIQAALGDMPDGSDIAHSVFAPCRSTPVDTVTPTPEAGQAARVRPGHAVPLQIDLRAEAHREVRRLMRLMAWSRETGEAHAAAVISRFRPRPPRGCRALWAFRLAMTTALDELFWETIVAATVSFSGWCERSAANTRSLLHPPQALLQVGDEAGLRQLELLRTAMRRPSHLWQQRELDLMDVLRHEHARLSARLLQPGLFDHRANRAAAAQAAMRDAALEHCRERLKQLRACEDLRLGHCELAFAVLLG